MIRGRHLSGVRRPEKPVELTETQRACKWLFCLIACVCDGGRLGLHLGRHRRVAWSGERAASRGHADRWVDGLRVRRHRRTGLDARLLWRNRIERNIRPNEPVRKPSAAVVGVIVWIVLTSLVFSI